MKLIDKSALLAEIDNILDYADEHWDTDYVIGAKRFADKLQDAIDTLEVKEVDFEKELDSMITPELKFHKALPSLFDVAKHFFELGLKAQKGEEV